MIAMRVESAWSVAIWERTPVEDAQAFTRWEMVPVPSSPAQAASEVPVSRPVSTTPASLVARSFVCCTLVVTTLRGPAAQILPLTVALVDPYTQGAAR